MNEADKRKNMKVFSSEYLDQIEHNSMKAVFDNILNNYQFLDVLDLGCGNGIFGIYLKEKGGGQIHGVDGSDYALERAKIIGYDKVIKVTDFCAEDLPFEDNAFDFVLCKDVLEHLLDPIHILHELIRVLKDDSYALIHVPNHFPLMYRVKFLFTNNIDTQSYFDGAYEWNFPHIRFFTHQGFTNMIERHGLKIVKDYSYFSTVFVPHTARIPGVKHFQQMLAHISPGNFVNGFTLLVQKVS